MKMLVSFLTLLLSVSIAGCRPQSNYTPIPVDEWDVEAMKRAEDSMLEARLDSYIEAGYYLRCYDDSLEGDTVVDHVRYVFMKENQARTKELDSNMK